MKYGIFTVSPSTSIRTVSLFALSTLPFSSPYSSTRETQKWHNRYGKSDSGIDMGSFSLNSLTA